MPNLYTFFGLPDPDDDDQPPDTVEEKKPQQLGIQTQLEDHLADSQRPPGQVPFHDLGEEKWSARTRKLAPVSSRAVRYVEPDEMHRLPQYEMSRRLQEGDALIVDLRGLVHMEAHQSACRRNIGVMAEEAQVPAFALDDEELVLLIPGHGSVVDTTTHHLGIQSEATLL